MGWKRYREGDLPARSGSSSVPSRVPIGRRSSNALQPWPSSPPPPPLPSPSPSSSPAPVGLPPAPVVLLPGGESEPYAGVGSGFRGSLFNSSARINGVNTSYIPPRSARKREGPPPTAASERKPTWYGKRWETIGGRLGGDWGEIGRRLGGDWGEIGGSEEWVCGSSCCSGYCSSYCSG